jgi:hypothetical protein
MEGSNSMAMRILSFTVILICVLTIQVRGQVKPEYLYNTNMPYGVLDIRTKISPSLYYYLQENKTFNFREESGVKTDTYLQITTWDSSPYKQGNLRKKTEAGDEFILNYRMLFPENYSDTYANGYPLVVLFHGALERGNCYYGNCFHSNFSYDPNVNLPPAPTTPDSKLLNNDGQLVIGGEEHLKARNAALGKLPDDPALPTNSFPGFVLAPQMLNVWDSLNTQDVIRLVLLHCEKYNIDMNRIYVEGLSIGGYGVYQAVKRAPWLFAGAIPMSATSDAAGIFKQNQQRVVRNVPLWIFQGAFDNNPNPEWTEAIIQKFIDAGSLPRYTKYMTTGHRVWEKSYFEPDFFQWMLSQDKSYLHVLFGKTTLDNSKQIYPTLVLAEGFPAYEWTKNGVLIPGANTNELVVKEPGVYRARFSRVSFSGTGEWNRWSNELTFTDEGPVTTPDPGTTPDPADPGENPDGGVVTGVETDESAQVRVFPNPVRDDVFYIDFENSKKDPLSVALFDMKGVSVSQRNISYDQGRVMTFDSELAPGLYLILLQYKDSSEMKRIVVE